MTAKESDARQAANILRRAGYQAYFVGGCVRDRLLGLSPKDFDIATDAQPPEVLALFPGASRVGAHFGVILAPYESGDLEIATFRSDHAYVDGRRPEAVTFETDARRDVVRRDFTMNALLQDPFTGEVFDYTGGREDLRAGLVRAVGNPEERFREDHLRMLRAIRFAARFHFALEEKTEAAIRSLRGLIRGVAAERTREELIRILVEGGARRGLELMERTGLLREILPEVHAMIGVPQPPEFHPEGDVWTHTLLMLDGLDRPTPELAMGVLLHDVGKPPTFSVQDRIRFNGHVEAGVEIAHRILTRLRFSGESIRQIEALVENHMRFKDAPQMRASTLKRFLRLERFDEHLELHRLDCLSSHGYLDNYDFVRNYRASAAESEIRPARLISGDDLIRAGATPGPSFGRVLAAVEDAQLEGRISTADEALSLALSMLSKPDSAST